MIYTKKITLFWCYRLGNNSFSLESTRNKQKTPSVHSTSNISSLRPCFFFSKTTIHFTLHQLLGHSSISSATIKCKSLSSHIQNHYRGSWKGWLNVRISSILSISIRAREDTNTKESSIGHFNLKKIRGLHHRSSRKPFASANNLQRTIHRSTIYAKKCHFNHIHTIPPGRLRLKSQKKSALTTLETSRGAVFVSKMSNARNKNLKYDLLFGHNSVRLKEVKFVKQSAKLWPMLPTRKETWLSGLKLELQDWSVFSQAVAKRVVTWRLRLRETRWAESNRRNNKVRSTEW